VHDVNHGHDASRVLNETIGTQKITERGERELDSSRDDPPRRASEAPKYIIVLQSASWEGSREGGGMGGCEGGYVFNSFANILHRRLKGQTQTVIGKR
jgi:hypothetical protein